MLLMKARVEWEEGRLWSGSVTRKANEDGAHRPFQARVVGRTDGCVTRVWVEFRNELAECGRSVATPCRAVCRAIGVWPVVVIVPCHNTAVDSTWSG